MKDLSKVIDSVRGLEKGLSGAAKDFAALEFEPVQGGAFYENSLVVSAPPDFAFTGKIAAVDGGIVSEEYQSCELVLYRAVCSVFEYEKGKVVRSIHRPVGIDSNQWELREAFDEFEAVQRNSIIRLKSEIDRAREAVELFNPSMVFLDGGIAPNPSDRPPKDSPTHTEFEVLLGSYRELYSSCKKNSTVLAGVVKDSKSRLFLEALARSKQLRDFYEEHKGFLARTNDSAFLTMALNLNQRTSSIPLDRKDFPADFFPSSPVATYLKAVSGDRPIRLEFLDPSHAGEASKVICGLCKGNSRYAYPAILIEADLRAALDWRELEVAYAQLCSEVGIDAVSLRKLRRNDRPFR